MSHQCTARAVAMIKQDVAQAAHSLIVLGNEAINVVINQATVALAASAIALATANAVDKLIDSSR